MHYLHYSDTELAEYPIVLLVPVIRRDDIRGAYLTPYGVNVN